MGLKKFQPYFVKEPLLYNRIKAFFSKIFIESGTYIMWSSVQVVPNQRSKNPSIRLKILTYKVT